MLLISLELINLSIRMMEINSRIIWVKLSDIFRISRKGTKRIKSNELIVNL